MSEGRKETPEEQTQRIMANMEKMFGFVPTIYEIMSERPDMFNPSAHLGNALMESRKLSLDKKTVYLCAVSAAASQSGEHCLRVQIKHALDEGANRDEILEAVMIGCYMTMTKAQSYALRIFREELGEPE
jgi:alkylhydroperoxidase/carboxymuconolactone decarboxylase family protein YurZ